MRTFLIFFVFLANPYLFCTKQTKNAPPKTLLGKLKIVCVYLLVAVMIKMQINTYTFIESYDMSFDVLLDATCAENIEIGDILSVTAWLSGKLRVRNQDEV